MKLYYIIKVFILRLVYKIELVKLYTPENSTYEHNYQTYVFKPRLLISWIFESSDLYGISISQLSNYNYYEFYKKF